MKRGISDGEARSAAGYVDRRRFLGLLAGGAAGVALPRLAFGQGGRERDGPPNVVIVFTDDQGYDDVGCFWTPNDEKGYEKIDTPHLDRTAAEGMKFTDFYVSAPVCTPSRASLMTGCYAQRVGLPGVLFPNSKVGINPDEITVAELLKTRGYSTACIGKWHLGDREPFLPTRHGFDYYYGIPYSNDMRPTVLMRNEAIVEEKADQDTLTRRYTEEAVKFITENRSRPFFLYLPHTMPHVPLHVSKDFKGRSRRGLYGDVITEIDWSVGKVLEALRKAGLDESTLVVFTSDNGPWLTMGPRGGKAYPLRYGKGTTWDGGMRVPCIMRWPGRISPGSTCKEVAATIDLYPTLAGLTGAKLPSDRVIDGKDIWPLMAGLKGAKSPHEALFFMSGGGVQAVRSGRWKFSFARRKISDLRWALPPAERRSAVAKLKKGEKSPEALYDLERDIGESVNVVDKHPEVASRLRAAARRFQTELKRNRRPPGRID